MNFRDFTEEVKDAIEALAAGVRGERPLTPMVHLESEDGVHALGVEAAFFESVQSRVLLVQGFVVPLIAERKARIVAWTFSGERTVNGDTFEVVVATVIDRERAEVWVARVGRVEERLVVGGWQPWQVDQADAPLLIDPVQEALR